MPIDVMHLYVLSWCAEMTEWTDHGVIWTYVSKEKAQNKAKQLAAQALQTHKRYKPNAKFTVVDGTDDYPIAHGYTMSYTEPISGITFYERHMFIVERVGLHI